MPRRAWAIDAAAALALGAAFLLFAFATPYIPGGDDAYRHVRFANRLVTETQAALADPWRLQYIWPQPVDVWFGYHALLAPFTLLFGLVTAAKLVGAGVWAGFAYVQLRLLHHLEVRWRHAWVLLTVAGSGLMLYRATLMRPFLASWLLVTLATLLTIREKPLWLAIVSALHAASYSIFFLAAMPVGFYFLIQRNRISLQMLAVCLAGCGAGLLLNPFFPENVKFAWEIANTRLGPDMARALKSGGEVLPIGVWWLAAAIPVLLPWAASIVKSARRPAEIKPSQWMLLLVSLATLAVSFRAARTFDYFPPAAIAFSASVLSPWVARNREKAAYTFGFLLLLMAATAVPALSTVRSAPSADRYRAASEYLAAAAPDALVLNTQWEQYPFLYFWNTQSRYLTGMEPALFYRADPDLYWLWRKLADDQIDGLDLAATAHAFGARFVLVDRDRNPRLDHALASDPRFRSAFANDWIQVLEIR